MEVVKDEFVKIEKAAQERLTVLWHELEAWQQDNIYIQRGYRPQSNSYKKSAQSLGYLHNETINIYTHLLGALLTLPIFHYLYTTIRPRYLTASPHDLAVFAAFFAGATACLTLSSTYHLFSNHSPQVARYGNQLDYLGIVLLIWGSFIPSVYYGFHDRPELITRYWTMITTIGVATAATTLAPMFRTSRFRPFRAGMFVAMGLSAVVPVLHGAQLYGWEGMRDRIGVVWLVLQGALYILGAGIYAARVPERWAPGRFDLLGSSHQIFHVLVLAAAASHLKGLLVAFDYWHSRTEFKMPWS